MSSVARGFPALTRNTTKRKKIKNIQEKWGMIEEMHLICPLVIERLATALHSIRFYVAIIIWLQFFQQQLLMQFIGDVSFEIMIWNSNSRQTLVLMMRVMMMMYCGMHVDVQEICVSMINQQVSNSLNPVQNCGLHLAPLLCMLFCSIAVRVENSTHHLRRPHIKLLVILLFNGNSFWNT